MNATTFLPVLVPLAPASTLLDRLPDEIGRILALHGIDPATIDAERHAMADVRIAPTNDRRVVGVLNEFSSLAGLFFEGDLTALALRLAGTSVGPLRTSHGFPDKALAAVLATPARPAEPPAEQAERAEPLAEVIAFPGMAPAPTTRPAPAATGARPAAGEPSVYQLKVTLLNTKPPIWRRVLVNGATTLDELHEVIQAAFGWYNCHLHEFEVGRDRYGVPDPDPDWGFGPPATDERTTRLDAVAGEGASFHYTYDFGDDWRHKVTVEKVTARAPGMVVPACTGGRRACPPEDCGGPWGYQELLDTLDGEFDPAAFHPDAFALTLADIRSSSLDL